MKLKNLEKEVETIGVMLHRGRLLRIASKQSLQTKDRLNRTKHFLDYVASQEDVVITYHASNMVLATHSDAGYNTMPQARSRTGGNFSCQTMKISHHQMEP